MAPDDVKEPREPTPPRRLAPPIWVWGSVLLCLIAIIAIRIAADENDRAIMNIVTLIVGFIGFVTLLTWFTWLSGYPKLMRTATLLSVLGVIAIAVAMLKVDGVNGEMVPRFTFRWNQPADQQLGSPNVVSQQRPTKLSEDAAKDFPQFLGPHRSATIEGIELNRNWQAHPPKRIWRQKIGAGWSGFSAVDGYAFTLEQRGPEEMVTCYKIETGKLVWIHAIKARHDTILGGVGPRSTPTIHEGKVYALGATGVLHCLDATTGNEVWPSKDLLKMFGVVPATNDYKAIAWGRSASPLIVDDMVVVPAGGPRDGPFVSLVAFDKNSGQQIWKGGSRQISYSSPSLVTIADVRQILIVNESSVTGHDIETGKVLWSHPWPGSSSANASASQAVILSGDRVLLSKAYGEGAALLALSKKQEGDWNIQELWHNPRVLKTKFTNVTVQGGYVYGLSDGILECVELQSGKRQWKKSSGRYGPGQILRVGSVILVQAESGEVAMVEATHQTHRELGRFAAIEGQTWNNLCLYGRYLLVRNSQEAACYELPLR